MVTWETLAAISAVGSSLETSRRFTSSRATVPVDAPQGFQAILGVGSGITADTSRDGAVDATLTWPTEGPVFNLPDGFTVNGPGIVNNRFVLNAPPVARCKNVTVSVGPDCTAAASIDDGSSDPDSGDTITVTQTPAAPYVLGDTLVTLTVTDNHGASNSCTAIVTVRDQTPPTVTCPGNIAVGCSVDRLVRLPST